MSSSPKPLPTPDPSSSIGVCNNAEISAKIDRLGELHRQLALVAPVEKEAQAIEDEVQTWLQDNPGDVRVLRGEKYQLNAGAKRSERIITDQKKAFALLRKYAGSLDGAIALVTLALGVIDKHIPKALQAQIVKKELSGKRPLECVPINAA